MSVFISQVSSPFDWVGQLMADRPVQAAGIVLESSETHIRLAVDDENALYSALDALGGVVVSDAALDDLAVSEKIRHCLDHERSANAIGMW